MSFTPYYNGPTSPGAAPGPVNTIAAGLMIDVDASDPANPIVNFDGRIFEATVGIGQDFADLDAANTAWLASGFPSARLYLTGTVSVGASLTLRPGVTLVGLTSSTVLELDFNINTLASPGAVQGIYSFQNLEIDALAGGAPGAINVLDNDLTFSFWRCTLTNNRTIALEMLGFFRSGNLTILLSECQFTDNTGIEGYFNNASDGNIDMWVRGTNDAGSGSAYLYRGVTNPTTLFIHVLDGSSITNLLVFTFAGADKTAFKDGSSTYTRTNFTGGGTLFEPRAGTAIETGTYTGDGTSSQVVSGWGFFTKYVRIWERAVTAGVGVEIGETNTTILADGTPAGSINITSGKFETDQIIGLGEGSFTVNGAAGTNFPNESAVDYNFQVVG